MSVEQSRQEQPAGTPGRDAIASGRCDYCGDRLSARTLVEREVQGRPQRYCCLGCAFIAEQLGRLPEQASAPAGAAPAPAAAPAGTLPTCVQMEIGGMVCAACAQFLEHRLRAHAGVRSASVDFVARRALVVFEPQATDLPQLRALVERTGYRVRSGADPAAERRAGRVELLRVLIAWLAMMQVMMLAVPSYLARPGEIAPGIEQMLRIAQLVLSAPVALFCALPFWRAAQRQLRVGHVGMDVPVALGLASALLASVYATIAGRGAVYFDSVTMFVALLLAVRWWQMRALARTTAQVDAAALQTRLRAQRLRRPTLHAAYDTVAAEELRSGDHIRVPLGEAFAADGRIVAGATSVSQAWLTGESAALDRGEGDLVLAGSLNLGQNVVVEVVRAGDATSLAALQRMIVEAASQRPRGVEIANRVASAFALGVLALAGLTALAWLAFDPAMAPRAAIAVLVVTCPCALSLAAPLAHAVAQARLAARGVLVSRPAALDALAAVDAVAFDKTGTLTEERPQLLGVQALGTLEDGLCIEIAAALEAHSQHPFARALVEAAGARDLAPPAAVRVAEVPGMGIEGIVAGARYRLGKAEYALALAHDPQAGARALSGLQRHAPLAYASQVVLGAEDGPAALLYFGETTRADAAALVRALARDGRGQLIISGDGSAAVERVAQELGRSGPAALACFANQSPAGKRRLLEQLQERGLTVAMVGDGINDAPILAQADASIALASGAKLAQVRADVIVLDSRLSKVRSAFDVAARTTRIVRQNLAWALGYNAVMVPLAASGRLAPWLASLGMALSAAFVLANSLRLRAAGRGA